MKRYTRSRRHPLIHTLEIRGANAPLFLGCALHSLQHINNNLVSEMGQMYCFWCALTNGRNTAIISLDVCVYWYKITLPLTVNQMEIRNSGS